ncbi:MAG: hypothetical protein LBJ64_05405 [Deltaproteobacteria bacterium]|jgi:cell division protein FtsZ|nr:hypothetical protein [Deltaproteobacteria bacterium]
MTNEVMDPIIPNDLAGRCSIMVFGLGGCGNNAVTRMVQRGMTEPVFVSANTDVKELLRSEANVRIQLGPQLTRGLGTGCNPALGRKAAEESMDKLLEVAEGADIIFSVAGLGGGTGSGSAPAFVEALGKLKTPPLVISVALMPFEYEMDRVKNAEASLKELLRLSHSVVAVSNQKFIELYPDASRKECWAMADDIMCNSVSCITNLILNPGDIHLDIADIRRTFSAKGWVIMGMGEASGENRSMRALDKAIKCPLMVNQSVKGAKVILTHVEGDETLKLKEVTEVNNKLADQGSKNIEVFSAYRANPSLNGSGLARVTVIITGLPYAFGGETCADDFGGLSGSDGRPSGQGAAASRAMESTVSAEPSGQTEAPLGQGDNFARPEPEFSLWSDQPTSSERQGELDPVSRGVVVQLDGEEPITLYDSVDYENPPQAAAQDQGYMYGANYENPPQAAAQGQGYMYGANYENSPQAAAQGQGYRPGANYENQPQAAAQGQGYLYGANYDNPPQAAAQGQGCLYGDGSNLDEPPLVVRPGDDHVQKPKKVIRLEVAPRDVKYKR